MTFSKLNHALSLFVITLCVATACAFSATWYVDPVNGDDVYDGSNPFHIPGTHTGPMQTIEMAAHMAGMYDILVLMDGLYAGPFNTGNTVFDTIDMNHLYVVSAFGPENCTLELFEIVHFDDAGPADFNTCFSGITFTSTNQQNYMPAIAIHDTQIRFTDCVLSGFQAENPDAPIIDASSNSEIYLEQCRFTANDIYIMINCNMGTELRITDSLFMDNHYKPTDYSYHPTGYIAAFDADIISVERCTFSNNTSVSPFAAISTDQTGHLFVEQCVIENNSSNSESCIGIHCGWQTDHITVQNTRIGNLRANGEYLHGDSGAVAMSVWFSNHLSIKNCQFNNNNTGLHVELEGQGPFEVDIADSEFIGNTAPDSQQHECYGIRINEHATTSHISIRNCSIQQNNSGISIGEGVVSYGGDYLVQNCLITDNEWYGLQIFPEGETSANVKNCTIANNGGYGLMAQNAIIENTILRQENGMPISMPHTFNMTLNYCNVQGGWGGPGIGNIDVDPLFVDPGYFDHDTQSMVPGTDYHLKSNAGRYNPVTGTWVQDQMTTPFSPCVDAGNPADLLSDEPYGSGGRINMGCYGGTWQASKSAVCTGGLDGAGRMPGDINRDCLVNLADIAWLAKDWLNSTIYEAPITE
jgi:hypothetical protein